MCVCKICVDDYSILFLLKVSFNRNARKEKMQKEELGARKFRVS